MGADFTDPPSYHVATPYRLVDIFSRVSTVEKKDEILKSFCILEGKLLLLISTTAFGMGVDIPNIRRIIHWGLASSLEDYVQETGRAGRDGSASEAILYQGRGLRHASQQIKNYALNRTICRRKFLFRNFLMYSEKDIKVVGCKCCDICFRVCTCLNCVNK